MEQHWRASNQSSPEDRCHLGERRRLPLLAAPRDPLRRQHEPQVGACFLPIGGEVPYIGSRSEIELLRYLSLGEHQQTRHQFTSTISDLILTAVQETRSLHGYGLGHMNVLPGTASVDLLTQPPKEVTILDSGVQVTSE